MALKEERRKTSRDGRDKSSSRGFKAILSVRMATRIEFSLLNTTCTRSLSL